MGDFPVLAGEGGVIEIEGSTGEMDKSPWFLHIIKRKNQAF